MKRVMIACSAVLLALCLVAPAAAQDKTVKCSEIRISVDLNDGSGWTNNYLDLALLEEGGGWVVASGDHRGENVAAKKGNKLRFNFHDGQGRSVDVNATTKSKAVELSAGNRPATVLANVTGTGTAAVNFEITGSPNTKARIGGCPGGNFYIESQ